LQLRLAEAMPIPAGIRKSLANHVPRNNGVPQRKFELASRIAEIAAFAKNSTGPTICDAGTV
jgi:hypothetical protein